MCSFEDAKRLKAEGYYVVVHHRDSIAGVREVIATCAKAEFITDYSSEIPSVEQTNTLTRAQAEELIAVGAEDERDADTSAA
jgi:hypothetical protein